MVKCKDTFGSTIPAYKYVGHKSNRLTGAGIDNNGALVFPYGKEDGDYRTEGDPSSGYAFNGAGSIFWRRLKNTFEDEIAEVMNSADANCFNAEDLIEEFDRFQECFPEEIWRLDIERKYIRTFTGVTGTLKYDNAVGNGKQNPRFLKSMMQGRKKYQRRQWIRDQGVYFNSKYRLSDVTVNGNTIEFNCTTPADTTNIALTPSYLLELTPYQDMYLNVQVGNGNYKDSYVTADGSKSLRAKANQTYTFDLKGNYQETRIYINGANHLSAIGNLAPMYPYEFDLRALAHIKALDIGTDVSGYTNTKFTSLTLPDFVPLLEFLNIKNCHSIAGTINLKNANNLRTVEAIGTAIAGISLPDYTNIETLHIPSTLTDLNLYGARKLSDFKVYNSAGEIDYSSLYKLHIYDSDYSKDVDWIGIAQAIMTKHSLETELSLLKLSTATIGDISTLEPLSEFKDELDATNGELDLSGIIHITGAWSSIEIANYKEIWPNLTFDTSKGTEKRKYKVSYEYEDGTSIKTLYIDEGEPAPDIYSTGLIDMPTKAQTEKETYAFGTIDDLTDTYIPYSGWRLSTSDAPISTTGTPYVFSNLIIYTYFVPTTRTYQIRWYLDNPDARLVKTSSGRIQYGQGYDQEAPTVQEIHAAGFETCEVSIDGTSATYSYFKGWEKLPTNITPSASDEYYAIHAVWEKNTVSINDLFADTSNLTPEQLLVLSGMNATNKNAFKITDKVDVGSRITCTMGADNTDVEGTVLVGDTVPLRLDATTSASRETAIQPLKNGSDGFTLAIDYCFNAEQTTGITSSFSTLVSCYYSDVSAGIRNGFSLFYGRGTSNNISGPRVGFGDVYNSESASVSVGNAATLGQRNIVVLRHPAGSSTLYIYSGMDGTSTLPTTVNVSSLNWSNYTSDAHLNIGQIGNDYDPSDGTPNSVVNGKGTIYWMKYWPEDLGQGECKRLAMWPHEQVTYGIAHLNSAATTQIRAASNTASSSILLASLSTTSHGQMVSQRQAVDEFSANSTTLRDICNKRIALGLPIELQSILCKEVMGYSVGRRAQDQGSGNVYYDFASSLNQRDYVRAYSATNVLPNDSIYAEKEDSLMSPLDWMDSVHVMLYEWNNGWVLNESNNDRVYYMNLRFPNKAITWGTNSNRMRVFRENSSTNVVSGSISTSIINAVNEVRSGDIYIMQKGGNVYTYIYVTADEVRNLGLQTVSTSFDSRLDANRWVRADEYWTRSVYYGGNGFNLANVYEQGTVNTNAPNHTGTDGIKLSQILAI